MAAESTLRLKSGKLNSVRADVTALSTCAKHVLAREPGALRPDCGRQYAGICRRPDRGDGPDQVREVQGVSTPLDPKIRRALPGARRARRYARGEVVSQALRHFEVRFERASRRLVELSRVPGGQAAAAGVRTHRDDLRART